MKSSPDFDIAVIGAGFSGMYAVYKFRALGYSVKGIEAAGDVGGVWWHNRYPGCRVDVESHVYCYPSCLDELRRTFDWTEKYAAQPEVLRYLYMAASYMDVRRDYLFNTHVKRAQWDDAAKLWRIYFQGGERAPLTARYLISGMGAMSAAQMPNVEGIHTFGGFYSHTAHWPRDPDPRSTRGANIDFSGQRVAVVGTGSSGAQIVQEVSKNADSVVVFQRSASWCTPLRNGPLTAEDLIEIRANFTKMDALCDLGGGNDFRVPIDKSILEVSEAERTETLERLYQSPGFDLWAANYRDVLVDKRANDIVTEFVANKVRQRVKDPNIAERLIPKDHGFGLRRVTLETNYFEAFNQQNVSLIDARATPIERINRNGVKTTDKQYDVDAIIYASGFDVLRGPLVRADILGRGGMSLNEAWNDGIRSYLGLQVPRFPNFFTLTGPQNATAFGVVPRNTVAGTDWLAGLIEEAGNRGLAVIETDVASADAYAEKVRGFGKASLLGSVDSWFTGVNRNIPGRERREVLLWIAGMPAYMQLCREIQRAGWRGFQMS